MDLTPEPRDDPASSTDGAWAVWDLPVNVATQVDDATGQDLIIVAIADRVYQLDWTRYADEWTWGSFAAIRRLLRLGPVAATIPEGTPATLARDYDPVLLKRFSKFFFSLPQPPTAPDSEFRIAVEPFGNEAGRREGYRELRQHNKAHVSVRGNAFTVELYHTKDEQFSLISWEAVWELIGMRTRDRVSSNA